MLLTINEILILFFVYSIIGWFIEIFYRTIINKKLYNPGVLAGPYIPLYGFAGILILQICSLIQGEVILFKVFIYFIIITVIELITGEFLLLFFNKRYWDYTDNKFNFRGQICLKFSIIWGIMAIIFEFTVLPLSLELMKIIPHYNVISMNYAIISILSIDFIMTTGVVNKSKSSINYFMSQYLNNNKPSILNFNNILAVTQELQCQSQKITNFLYTKNEAFYTFHNKNKDKIKKVISDITIKIGLILVMIKNIL